MVIQALNLTSFDKSSISLAKMPMLWFLCLVKAKLKRLDLRFNHHLRYLHIGDTNISFLDLRSVPMLSELFAGESRLYMLNCAHIPEICILDLSDTKIQHLRLNLCYKLRKVWLPDSSFRYCDLRNSSGKVKFVSEGKYFIEQ